MPGGTGYKARAAGAELRSRLEIAVERVEQTVDVAAHDLEPAKTSTRRKMGEHREAGDFKAAKIVSGLPDVRGAYRLARIAPTHVPPLLRHASELRCRLCLLEFDAVDRNDYGRFRSARGLYAEGFHRFP